MAVTADHPRPRKAVSRAPLSRERIAAAALELMDRKGLEGCTMRALGTKLKVEAMSLYHHFPNQEALLDAVMELLVAEIEIPAAGPWTDRLRRAAWSHRATALRHPHAWPLLVTRPYATPRLLKYCDDLCGIVLAAGLDAEASAGLFRMLGHFMDGALLYTALGPGRAHKPAAAAAIVDADLYPRLAQLGPYLRRDLAATYFEFGLERLIADFTRLVKQHRQAR